MSRGASLATELPSLAVPAFLPCQYQLCFLGSTSSLAVPAASLAVPKACPMNPHCTPRLYILTHSSPQFAVQRPQRGRKEGAQRRGGQRHQDRVLARKGRLRTEKGAAMHGVCGDTLRETQKLECAVEQRLGISGRVCGDTGFAGDTEA